MPADPNVTLRVLLLNPPEGVDFAIQQGRGAAYETVQKQRSRGANLEFEFAVAVREGPAPALAGPFVQGPPAGRFIYIDVGTYAGQSDTTWSRRIKIPLKGITRNMMNSGAVLEARIPGRARDGGPASATVEPEGGWIPR
jgi:hypothetical protein